MTKIRSGKTQKEIENRRRQKYLEKWPIHKQLEAYKEAEEGNRELLDEMIKDMNEIKRKNPYSRGG